MIEQTHLSSIYFLGIGGTAMASVAVALNREGYQIRGSDHGVYSPMSDILSQNDITYYDEFDPSHVSPSPDLVVVGNAISRGNVELEEVLNRKIPYTSLASLIQSHLIRGLDSIVISGTHGKTSTTSLTSWIFECADLHPGFMIGGIPLNFSEGCRSAKGNVFIIEGDEYDTAFFDKRSKFHHYSPDVAVINNMEFDHADIFNSIDDVKRTFKRFVNIIPSNGFAIVNGDDANVMEVIKHAFCKVETYGFGFENMWRVEITYESSSGIKFNVYLNQNFLNEFTFPLTGKFNVYNSLAAIAIAQKYSIPPDIIQKAFSTFRGVKRRMEIIGEVNGIIVIDDFAHHPTAIRETLKAIRTVHPKKKIRALFEPRSNTTTRNIFQNELANSFDDADVIIIGAVNRPERFSPAKRLSPEKLVDALQQIGKEAYSIPDVDEMISTVISKINSNDVIVFFSNGEFGGARKKIIDKLKSKEK